MNNFSSTANNSGLLKNYYDSGSRSDSMLDALKRRRDKLTDKVVVPTKEKLEGSDTETKILNEEER